MQTVYSYVLHNFTALLQPVYLAPNEVRLELTSAPAHTDTRPAVAIAENAETLPVGNARRLLLRFVEHQVLEALGAFQRRDVQTALAVELLVQSAQVLVHLRELHAGVRVEHGVDRPSTLQHEQEHGSRILAARKGDDMERFSIQGLFLLASKRRCHSWL